MQKGLRRRILREKYENPNEYIPQLFKTPCKLDKNSPLSQKLGSEWVCAAERASGASSAQQANEQADEQVVHY